MISSQIYGRQKNIGAAKIGNILLAELIINIYQYYDGLLLTLSITLNILYQFLHWLIVSFVNCYRS